jgi:dihydropteroate synthase
MLSDKTLNLNGQLKKLDKSLVMGILNITPDSFYQGNRFSVGRELLDTARLFIEQGADILDIGAYSSRPGADLGNTQKELERIEPALSLIREHFPDVILSVDTFRAKVAEVAVEKYNVNIINDISAGSLDADLFETVAALHVPYILMHMQGRPENMQQNPTYEDIETEVINFLAEKLSELHQLGVNDVIIDPGFGFGKTIEQNYKLMAKLELFTFFDAPLLVGISRKSMIYKLLETDPTQALNGTTALHLLALTKGANILRVHDVKQAVEIVRIFEKLVEQQLPVQSYQSINQL